MSKLSSCERFFIDLIALGMETDGKHISKQDIQQLLSCSPNHDRVFLDSCISALNVVYATPSFPRELIEEQVKKLYCGKDSLLQEAVLQWYKGIISPTLFQKLKRLVQGQ